MIKVARFLVALMLLPAYAYALSTDVCFDTDTKLMLHANGTEASTTFTDSSTSAKTVTANGNSKIHTSKFSSNAGFFDGTTDKLTVPDSADWDFGTGDFTIDFWVRFKSVAASASFVDRNDQGQAVRWVQSLNQLRVDLPTTSNAIIASWTPVANQWYHVAVTRSGTSLKAFVDGTSIGTATNSADVQLTNEILHIGDSEGGGVALNGWMDELRLMKGTAAWTANFTPPTTEHTSDANTKLLLHMNGSINSTSFIDSGNTVHTITANGDAKQAGVTVFGTGSAAFDGTGDNITTADSTDWDVSATDPITIDMWVKFNTVSSPMYFFDRFGVIGVYYAAGEIFFDLFSGSFARYVLTPTPGVWYHIAAVKEGNGAGQQKVYVNGVVGGTTSTHNTALDFTAGTFNGTSWTGASGFDGNIDEFRFIKGTAVWASNFTPPSSEYSPCTNRRRLTSLVSGS